jgi:NAD(P)-dependent dehydrogenase (short-subunit alcohol dehydrogenase family)
MAGRLAHKVAVVTGGAKGIGQAIASRFAREGARVVVADVQEAEAGAVAQQLVGAGYEAAAVRCDVSKAADVDHMVQFAVERFGSLDIMVANAGAPPPRPAARRRSSSCAAGRRPPPAPRRARRPRAAPRRAGIVRAAPFLEMSEQDFDDVVAVNLKGVFLSCQAAARQMARQVAAGGGGSASSPGRAGYSIITMSSVNGLMAIPTIAG